VAAVPELRGDRILLNAHTGEDVAAHVAGVTHLEAHVAADNHASRRVAEAVGFTQAGTVVDDGAEMICYTRRAPGSGPALLIPAR
jgi:RimJ/RimL family protein N-acetyltransferase